uniref:Uncharacterized protein n=1 Tax=Anopheles dirus TaxID=7168 RepID=A0A182NWX3_9DIPT
MGERTFTCNKEMKDLCSALEGNCILNKK